MLQRSLRTIVSLHLIKGRDWGGGRGCGEGGGRIEGGRQVI